MDRHSENAIKINEQLKKHPRVKNVYFPWNEENAGHEAAIKQMKQPGGVISFELQEGGKQEAQAFLNKLQLIKIAVSLGDVETLISHPASMTHAVIPEKERRAMGVTDQLIRLSVGLESWEDIWADIEQALNGWLFEGNGIELFYGSIFFIFGVLIWIVYTKLDKNYKVYCLNSTGDR